MQILHLSLTNFRNYARLELDLPMGVTLLHGDNAQGKTNLLEAIYFLSHIRSPRATNDRELMNWLALNDSMPFVRLVAQFQRGSQVAQIELALLQSSTPGLTDGLPRLRKHVRVNGAPKRATDAAGMLTTVLFLPQDIDLVSSSPGLRRRYLDDSISQIDPTYNAELQKYNHVLVRRNYLLKSFRGRSYDPAQLLFWDKKLVAHGAYLLVQRRAAVQILDDFVQRIHPLLTEGKETLTLEYRSNVPTQPSCPTQHQCALLGDMSEANCKNVLLEQAAEAFSAELGVSLRRELAQGASVVGPHRDDFKFFVNGTDMNVFGSRGQQRTAALSTKLAEVEWLTRAKGDKPVLLLDDIISELDGSHRQCVLAAIDAAQQVIITTTDPGAFSHEFMDNASLCQVQAGKVVQSTSQ